jgi:hypothetical protein
MNCPSCSLPLMFGATTCPCGYDSASSPDEELPIELTYWEVLRVYWRVYWPGQVAAVLASFFFAIIWLGATHHAASGLLITVLQIPLAAATLFLFVPRICSRPYRGFCLVVIDLESGGTSQKLRGGRRKRVWLFLWWRQFVAAWFASMLALPLNAMLIMMGLQLQQLILAFAGVLVVGPILLKMLIGNQFDDFRIEARREIRV